MSGKRKAAPAESIASSRARRNIAAQNWVGVDDFEDESDYDDVGEDEPEDMFNEDEIDEEDDDDTGDAMAAAAASSAFSTTTTKSRGRPPKSSPEGSGSSAGAQYTSTAQGICVDNLAQQWRMQRQPFQCAVDNPSRFSYRVLSLLQAGQNLADIDALTWFVQFYDENAMNAHVNRTNRHALWLADEENSLERPWYVPASHAWPPIAVQKLVDKPLTLGEYQVWLGITLLTGIVSFPSRRDLWRHAWPFQAPLSAAIMSRDRFEHIRAMLYFAASDDKPDGAASTWKVDDMIAVFNRNAAHTYTPAGEVSGDECMVRCESKAAPADTTQQKVPKPIGHGMMYLAIAETTGFESSDAVGIPGYLCRIQLRRKGHTMLEQWRHLLVGFGASNDRHRIIYLDRMNARNGVVQMALQMPAHMFVVATLDKRSEWISSRLSTQKLTIRGEWAWDALNQSNDDCVFVYKWLDSVDVYVLSTVHPPTSTTTVPRRIRGVAGRTPISAPVAAAAYNVGMGGVDAGDSRRSAVSVDMRRTKKWTLKIFYFFLDICVCNAIICAHKAKWYVQKTTTNNASVPRMDMRAWQLRLVHALIRRGLGHDPFEAAVDYDDDDATSAGDGSKHLAIVLESRARCSHCSHGGGNNNIRSSFGCSHDDCRGKAFCLAERQCWSEYHRNLV